MVLRPDGMPREPSLVQVILGIHPRLVRNLVYGRGKAGRRTEYRLRRGHDRAVENCRWHRLCCCGTQAPPHILVHRDLARRAPRILGVDAEVSLRRIQDKRRCLPEGEQVPDHEIRQAKTGDATVDRKAC